MKRQTGVWIDAQVWRALMDAEQAQKMLNKIHQIREKLKSDGKGRRRKGRSKAQG